MLLHLIEKHHGSKMLEVGCGNDKLASLISKKIQLKRKMHRSAWLWKEYYKNEGRRNSQAK